MKVFGGFIASIAALLLLYTLNMDTTVATAMGEVHNIGLMDRKQTFLIVSLAFLMIGIGLLVAGPLIEGQVDEGPAGTSARKCPECAEEIKAEARRCKHCSADVEPLVQECDFCGLQIKKPVEPCSAFDKDQIKQSLDRIRSQSCINALAQAKIIGLEPPEKESVKQ